MAKVLVVDDDPDLAAVCALVLESEGYDIDIARNGVDAVEALRTTEPDVVLLDVMLPAVDGLSVCQMAKRDPAIGKVPIILMSASSHLLRKAGEACADAVLGKPFDIDVLLNTVGKFAAAG